MTTLDSSITIRPAHPLDAAGLARLAALDSARVPAGDLRVAEQGGELRAAIALADGRAIADPFHRTADLVDLLRVRAHRSAAHFTLRSGRRIRHALAARR